jgi:hypothetical protein
LTAKQSVKDSFLNAVNTLQLTIPAQSNDPAGLKIKPREVQAWLDDLPFLDLQRTTRLVREQLRLMNRQAIAAGTRLEILGLFLATYQRLVDALPAGHRDADPLPTLVKRLCQDIGFGYKIVASQLVNQRSGFIESRNLPLALLGSIHTLGLQLLDCYSAYRNAPRSLWSECLALYGYAWQSGREQYTTLLPGFGKQQIDANFRLSALIRLADPYQLPAGMVKYLHQYLAQHVELSGIHETPASDKNCFQLKDVQRESTENEGQHLYLEVDDLLQQVNFDIEKLVKTRQSRAIGLPAEVPSQPFLHCLKKVLQHWQYNPTRLDEREEAHARIELVHGLHATYCMVNRQRPFDPALFLTSDQANDIELTANPTPAEPHKLDLPEYLSCTSLNRSSGGLAVRYRGRKKSCPRVGQLVAVRRPEAASGNHWVVAACRWLMEAENSEGFEMGMQYLTREPRPVVIRLVDESGPQADYEPAIAAEQKRGQAPVHTLITRSGGITRGALLSLFENGNQQQIRCIEQLDDCPGFQRFIYIPAND